MSLVEVTNAASKVSYQKMSFTTRPLQIPDGGKSYIRKFVCEMSYQHLWVRSDVAELIVIRPGKTKGGE